MLIESGQFFKKLCEYDEEGCLMSGSTLGEDTFTESQSKPEDLAGLVPGHAYSIIRCIEVQGNQLMNIRNPWGKFEWGGDWSDTCDLWTKEIIDEVKPIFDETDGSFWMCFEDFIKFFRSVCVCRVENWNEIRIRGKFLRI